MKSTERLDRRISFHKPKYVKDDCGSGQDGWTEEFIVWANVRYLRGSESVMASRLSGKRPVILTVRKSSNSKRIAPDWKCHFDNMDFNIREHPRLTDNRLYYEFLAEGGVAVGQ